jgi:hypothetical protein
MIDYLQLVKEHKKVSFTWYGRKIEGVVHDYDDPEDEEIAPAILAVDNEFGGNMHKEYYTKYITNLEVID